jgi:hypothetical protein
MRTVAILSLGALLALSAAAQYVTDVEPGKKGSLSGTFNDLKARDGKYVEVPGVLGLAGVNYVGEAQCTMSMQYPLDRVQSLTFGATFAADRAGVEGYIELYDYQRKRWERCEHVEIGLDYVEHQVTEAEVARFVSETKEMKLRVRADGGKKPFILSIDRVVFTGKLSKEASTHDLALKQASTGNGVRMKIYESSPSGKMASRIDSIRKDWEENMQAPKARAPSNQGALKKSMQRLNNKGKKGKRGGKKGGKKGGKSSKKKK